MISGYYRTSDPTSLQTRLPAQTTRYVSTTHSPSQLLGVKQIYKVLEQHGPHRHTNRISRPIMHGSGRRSYRQRTASAIAPVTVHVEELGNSWFSFSYNSEISESLSAPVLYRARGKEHAADRTWKNKAPVSVRAHH